MLGTTQGKRTLRIHDVSDVLSILAAANRWGAYFALLARCAPEAPACDPRKRQRIPRVVDVKEEG